MSALSQLVPVSTARNKLSDSVFDKLSEAIVEGALPPGERLPEARLAGALEVSRMPVREALARLEARHLVARDANGTCLVARWDTRMLREVATLRGALEGLAAHLAAGKLSAEDVDHLQSLVVQMGWAVERGDHDRLIQLDIAFHSHIWSCAGHQLLQEMLEALRPQVRYFMYLTRPGDEDTYPQTHQEVIDVLRAGDATRAEAVIREHILDTAERAITKSGK